MVIDDANGTDERVSPRPLLKLKALLVLIVVRVGPVPFGVR
jgi:hypothetical protein